MPFEDSVLQKMTDIARVKKIYKLISSGDGSGKRKGQVNRAVDERLNGTEAGSKVDGRTDLEISILGCMALRGVTN